MAFMAPVPQARDRLAEQDERDLAICEAIKARDEPGVPHETFMASLETTS